MVTTMAGQPNAQERLASTGVDSFDQLAARAATQFEVAAGDRTTPDIYLPQCIRVDSQGCER